MPIHVLWVTNKEPCVPCSDPPWCRQETLDWLTNPDNANSSLGPPGITEFNAVPYFAAALPISLVTFGTQLVHELGHRVAASIRKVGLEECCMFQDAQQNFTLLVQQPSMK